MDINFNCYQCGQNLDVDPGAAGTEVSCPNCGATVVVPHQTRRKEKPAPDYIPVRGDPPPRPPVIPESRSLDPLPAPEPLQVVVKDFEMEFGSMVVFMIKWTIAAIPAIIILSVLLALILGVLTAFWDELSR